MARRRHCVRVPLHAVESTNDGYTLRSAALAGAGLIIQPEVLLADEFTQGVSCTNTRFVPAPLDHSTSSIWSFNAEAQLMSLIY
ncbi:hypothetical protein LJR034_007604 [Caballeronia sp. LjRoot34]|uniref:hypothetical protein n=1 Tax=Caballeronia sp. LjRoot34 TaxID=3342325 RepID=UPI003ED0BD9D